jgi:hypothetical protein
VNKKREETMAFKKVKDRGADCADFVGNKEPAGFGSGMVGFYCEKSTDCNWGKQGYKGTYFGMYCAGTLPDDDPGLARKKEEE